jgi:hypothetical protein
MSHRLLAGAAALALLAAPAVAAAEVHRFQSVDAVDSGFLQLFTSTFMFLAITGVDESGARVTRRFGAFYGDTIETHVAVKEQCDRMAMIALAKPGRFLLEVASEGEFDDTPALFRCKLVRND